MNNYLCKEIRLDISNICNLSCPLCPNTNRRNKKTEEKHLMSFENFKKLVDNIDSFVETISIGTKHEALLNDNIFLMTKYLHNKYPDTDINLLSNFNFNYNAEDIIKSGITNIIIGLDGIDQESYSKYRVGGNFNNVLQNIKQIQEYKNRYNLNIPTLTISFIVFSHNEHLIPKAKELFSSLGINIFFRRTDYHDGYESWLPKNFHNEQPKEENKDINKNNIICQDPFNILDIDTFGNVLPCCAEEALNYFVGNIFEEKLSTIWNGKKLKQLRDFLISKQTENDNIPCKFCPVYKNNGYTNYVKFEN